MKISIKNFGPIDHFEFDLEKDLHVIYGENNIGKSWAISVVYLLLKSYSPLLNLSYQQISIIKENQENFKKKIGKGFFFFETIKEEDEFIDNLNISVDNSFGETKNLISNIEPEIVFTTNDFQLKINKNVSETDDYPPHFYNAGYTFDELLEKGDINSYQKYKNIYFLPASKSGIYQVLSNMGNIFAQLSQLPLKNTSLNLPSMSIPVSDYILNIAAINSSKQGEFGDFVDFLEEKVIEGSVVFDDFQKKLKYKSNRTGLVSELHEASSMIAEISPLVAYLKYILPKKNSILFIEEPEAHLHPKVQVEMMKIFVDLAKSGVKVVMTTHSDFMMDTLTNQILDGKIDADKIASYHLEMGDKGSYDVGDMKATSEGIRDFNFSKTSVALYEERMQLLERKQESEDVD